MIDYVFIKGHNIVHNQLELQLKSHLQHNAKQDVWQYKPTDASVPQHKARNEQEVVYVERHARAEREGAALHELFPIHRFIVVAKEQRRKKYVAPGEYVHKYFNESFDSRSGCLHSRCDFRRHKYNGIRLLKYVPMPIRYIK